MPITLLPVGTTLDVSVVDDNFVTIQDVLRSGLVKDDILNQIQRMVLRRYTGGRLVSAASMALPIVKEGDTSFQHPQTRQIFDLAYRPSGAGDGDMATVNARTDTGSMQHHAWELLGRPGPSFYYQWQEDGFPDPPTQYGAPVAGWPPAGWPYDAFDKKLCYSRWLTVPGCSLKLYVPYPAVLRLTGQATGSLTLFAYMRYLHQMADPLYPYLFDLVDKLYAAYRFGLIIDTNPVLDTEFANTNTNILDPALGSMAPYVSWKIIEDKTHYAAQRETFHQESEVYLQGGKWYNVRFAYRSAETHGWVGDLAGVDTFSSTTWEAGLAAPPAPVHTLWPSVLQEHPFHPPWINLWDAAQLGVELDYGRSAAFCNHHGGAGLQTKGSYP